MWATKTLILDLGVTSEERKLQLSELDEIRVKAYENTRTHKERANLLHNRHIYKKGFFLD